MKTCVYCGQWLRRQQPAITISNTDVGKRRHILTWHIPCTRIDPVYRAVVECPRIPGNALMVIEARQREREARA